MPQQLPHPSSLLLLVPENDYARAVLSHPDNSYLMSSMPNNPGEECINVGFHISSKSRYTLATMGRCDADITVQGPGVSRIQCSFEIHEESGVIMLYDRSSNSSTQTFGKDVAPFEYGRIPRRVVLIGKKEKETDIMFGFGGVNCDLFKFRIIWYQKSLEFGEYIENRADNPRLARTIDDTPTTNPSLRHTRIHTTIKGEPLIRYQMLEPLGRGSFGEVVKAVDVDTGKFMAVKRIKWPETGLQTSNFLAMKREVETLARISHVCQTSILTSRYSLRPFLSSPLQPNIVEFITAQGFGAPYLDIFMKLKEGNLENLIRMDRFTNQNENSTSLLGSMLQALDYLAYNKIVHRDVKPANILYSSLPNDDYRYQLTDFGLCNVATEARTYAGSPPFMAPEVLQNREILQTPKVDVWSLFVTMVYAMNVGGYRQQSLRTNEQRVKAVLHAAKYPVLQKIKEMALVNPEERASAAQMLLKLFDGEGLSTPRGQIHGALIAPRRTVRVQRYQAGDNAPANVVGPTRKVIDTRRHTTAHEYATTAPRLCRKPQPRIMSNGVVKSRGQKNAKPALNRWNIFNAMEHFPMPGKYPEEE